MSSDFKLLVPDAQANKYTRGKLTVIAGSARYPGAAVLAARASQRMGAGYTEVVTAKQAVDIVRNASASLVVRRFSEWDASELPAFSEKKPCAVCLGPGFEGSEAEIDVVNAVLGKAHCPVLVDGGALFTLALSKKALKLLMKRAEAGCPTMVTPHGGEAARLARSFDLRGSSIKKISAGLAYALQATVVLKGPDTCISNGTTSIVVTEGTAALAKAGTGDVLAGMISALLAQGLEPMTAARLGVVAHARAGAVAAEDLTEIAVIAEDVIDRIPAALKTL